MDLRTTRSSRIASSLTRSAVLRRLTGVPGIEPFRVIRGFSELLVRGVSNEVGPDGRVARKSRESPAQHARTEFSASQGRSLVLGEACARLELTLWPDVEGHRAASLSVTVARVARRSTSYPQDDG